MIYTAGIFLFNKDNNLLIVHPTNAPKTKWSIPKGLVDDNEDVYDAAVRELFEETNIDIRLLKPVFVRRGDNVPYKNKKKTLCPFFVKVFDDMDNIELKCTSMVEIAGKKPFPENDKFLWCSLVNAKDVIHETQVEALNKMIFV